MPKGQRQYTEAEKAEALALLDANGGNQAKTARDAGIPRATLRLWASGQGVPFTVAATCQVKKRDLAAALEDLVWKCLDVLPGKLDQAGGPAAAATTLGIAFDKMRLLREQPTAISETRETGMSEDERADQLAALLDESRNRRRAAVPDGGGTGGSRPAPLN